jgi:hypothetical protein
VRCVSVTGIERGIRTPPSSISTKLRQRNEVSSRVTIGIEGLPAAHPHAIDILSRRRQEVTHSDAGPARPDWCSVCGLSQRSPVWAHRYFGFVAYAVTAGVSKISNSLGRRGDAVVARHHVVQANIRLPGR